MVFKTSRSLQQMLDYFKDKMLKNEKSKIYERICEDGDNKYIEGVTSSKTNEKVEAWEQITLCKLPVILILHLKFFKYINYRCTKIIKAFDFEFDLKFDSTLISSETQSPTKRQYKLFAVVYHEGKNANIGHYVTDAFHVGYNCWIRYDDSSVKTVQNEDVLKPQGTRVPYLLFYRKSDIFLSK